MTQQDKFNKEVTRRLFMLETSLARLQRVSGFVAQAIEEANSAIVECGSCGNNVSAMKYCENSECPCGLSKRNGGEGLQD